MAPNSKADEASIRVITIGKHNMGMPRCPDGCIQVSLSGIRSVTEAQRWGLRQHVRTVYFQTKRGRVYAFKPKESTQRCDAETGNSPVAAQSD